MNQNLCCKRNREIRLNPSLVGVFAVGMASMAPDIAYAQQASPPEQTGTPGNPAVAPADKPYVAPVSLSEWASNIKLGFQGQGGITVNTLSPSNRRNFGQLFNDNSNRPILNQLLATVSRDVDPKATSVDVGFKLQLMYGSGIM